MQSPSSTNSVAMSRSTGPFHGNCVDEHFLKFSLSFFGITMHWLHMFSCVLFPDCQSINTSHECMMREEWTLSHTVCTWQWNEIRIWNGDFGLRRTVFPLVFLNEKYTVCWGSNCCMIPNFKPDFHLLFFLFLDARLLVLLWEILTSFKTINTRWHLRAPLSKHRSQILNSK